MDLEEAIAAGGEALLGMWFALDLSDSLRQPEDDSEERRELRLAAAKAAVEELAGPDAELGARMQAVQLVCAHASALDWQARANSPYLATPERLTAQRFARQMMTLTTRQLASLSRLKAERRRTAEAEDRRAGRERERATRAQLARGHALVDEMERMLKDGAAAGVMEGAIPAAPPEAMPAAAAPAPQPTGASVPEAPSVPETLLDRQQRRAFERQERKRRRDAVVNASREQ